MRITAVNHNYDDNQLTTKNTETDKVDQNPPITVHEHDLLTMLSQMCLFSKRSAAVIDGSEKCSNWLNLELQSLHVIEMHCNFLTCNLKRTNFQLHMLPATICCDVSSTENFWMYWGQYCSIFLLFLTFLNLVFLIHFYLNCLPQEVKSNCKFIYLNLQVVKHPRCHESQKMRKNEIFEFKDFISHSK